jgi:hypothetical protein
MRRAPRALRDQVTVVITTSPVVSHPHLSLLEATLASFAHAPDLHDCKVIIVADGWRARPKRDAASPDVDGAATAPRRKFANISKAMRSGMVDEEYAGRYEEMKERLTARCAADAGKRWHPTEAPFAGVHLLYLKERFGYGFALREALSRERGLVSTRYVLVVQHDRTWLRYCPVAAIVSAMEASTTWSVPATPQPPPGGGGGQVVKSVSIVTRSTLNYLRRIEGRPNVQRLGLIEDIKALVRRPPELRDVAIDDDSKQPFFAPLLQFYDSTHIALTDFYREFVFEPRFRLVSAGGFVEDKLSVALMSVVRRDGLVRGHGKFGCYLYEDGRSWDEVRALSGAAARAATADTGGCDRRQENGSSHRPEGGAAPIVGHLDGGSFLTEDQRALVVARQRIGAAVSRADEAT